MKISIIQFLGKEIKDLLDLISNFQIMQIVLDKSKPLLSKKERKKPFLLEEMLFPNIEFRFETSLFVAPLLTRPVNPTDFHGF